MYIITKEFGIRIFSRVLSFKFESTMRIRFMQHLIESMYIGISIRYGAQYAD